MQRLGIEQPVDLLFHLPFRYQDRTKVTPIDDLRPGIDVVVVGQIMSAEIRYGRRRSLLVTVADETGLVTLRFFHFSQPQQKSLHPGAWIRCYGEVRRGPASLEMVHPEYRVTERQPEMPVEQTLTPVYPATEGVGPNIVRRLVIQSLKLALPGLVEFLPGNLRDQFKLLPIRDAILTVHQPPAEADTESLTSFRHPAQQRLALEEMTAHHLALYQLKQQRNTQTAPQLASQSQSWTALEPKLGFKLTVAQQRVISEVASDLTKNQPALRMIQGDVGSGKTVVAAAAALQAIDAGYQVAIMAPTELLAEQHRKSFSQWFGLIGIEVQWLTGKMSALTRRDALEKIASGKAQLVVGTHALFQEQVEFHRLGLIIVDEQHRFGVDQRLALRNKGSKQDFVPHQLIMSATPIPRSLAMVFYADLEVSSIDELPPGRKQVTTIVLPETRRTEIVERIHHVCQQGQQVYWVCPLIEESDKLQAQAATETWQTLQEMLPDLKIELVHGRMKSAEKDAVMQRFRDGNCDLLVATTVIEVGVDVPNANLMIIENAERLGLAQLHQLRGRVGRGADQANCVLLYKPPLGRLAKERLALLRDSNDGFEIAQKDLEQRGPGEMLGTRQTGLQQLRIADLGRDVALFPVVEKIAQQIRTHHPEVVQPLIHRWIRQNDIYANV
ncbi:MAG: ATP-dependent DNA helicase RecG [Gammaproteobacteria bacterium]